MCRSLLLASLALLVACTSLLGPAEPLEIRVANESALAFERVLVGFPDRTEDYGPIAPQALTGYRPVGGAYRYALIEVRLEERTLVLQPIDYVGESLLAGGRYTYVLQVDPLGDHLSLSLRRDR